MEGKQRDDKRLSRYHCLMSSVLGDVLKMQLTVHFRFTHFFYFVNGGKCEDCSLYIATLFLVPHM